MWEEVVDNTNTKHPFLWEMTLVQWEPSSPPPGKLSQRSPSRKTLRVNWNAWITWLLKISLKYSLRRKGEDINAHTFRIGCKQNEAHRQKMLWAKVTHLLHQGDKGTGNIHRFILLTSLMNNHGLWFLWAGKTWVQNRHQQWVTKFWLPDYKMLMSI